MESKVIKVDFRKRKRKSKEKSSDQLDYVIVEDTSFPVKHLKLLCQKRGIDPLQIFKDFHVIAGANVGEILYDLLQQEEK